MKILQSVQLFVAHPRLVRALDALRGGILWRPWVLIVQQICRSGLLDLSLAQQILRRHPILIDISQHRRYIQYNDCATKVARWLYRGAANVSAGYPCQGIPAIAGAIMCVWGIPYGTKEYPEFSAAFMSDDMSIIFH